MALHDQLAPAITDYSRLCVHTITTKPWSLEEAAKNYAAAGVQGVTVWRQWLEGRDIKASGDMLRDHGLRVVSLCRGGFFPSSSASGRKEAVEENLRAIDEAEALGAPLVVLVCGAVPDQSLETNRGQISDGIAAVAEHARQVGVKLAIEPLHPMYAAERSAVNTMRQANDMCDALNLSNVGVAVDVYHLWWDSELKGEIERCGKADRLYAFHVCDWRSPTVDFLNDRGLMGEGCIPIRKIRGWAEQAGFDGFIEVEIFSNRWWAADQKQFLDAIKAAYLKHV